jgi:hypothetical protein
LDILIAALMLFYSHLDESTARTNAEAASAAADAYGFPVELLLAQAWVESRYQPTSVSRMMCKGGTCTRKTGVWEYKKPPKGAQPSYYCGVMQVGGWISWEDCVALMEDIPANYMEGAAELRRWTESRLCRSYKGEGRLSCALRGYGGGNAATANLEMTYPVRVLSKRDMLMGIRHRLESSAKNDAGSSDPQM